MTGSTSTQTGALLKAFLRHPTKVGAVCPSSPALCRVITSEAKLESAKVIVELGPGTGVFTAEILKKKQAATDFLAFELDTRLYGQLCSRFGAQYFRNQSAEAIGEALRENHLKRADVIISGLPWAVFPGALQDSILTAVYDNLAEEGTFCTFAYLQSALLPKAQRFRRRLNELFDDVQASPIVWRNFPPAFVYRCRKTN
ncbi:MAG: rRNA adenine N-6-methyltransferase family protein [Victivallaceae bacterium]|nr:rRNA adenine N-6-methyltransferase family protein [Victivallaceae bacterium]